MVFVARCQRSRLNAFVRACSAAWSLGDSLSAIAAIRQPSVGSFRLGIEHAHIGDGVLFVINGEHFTEGAASATWRLRVGRTGALSRKN